MDAIFKIESTKAKAKFASLPEAARTKDVAITRHGKIQAYVLSPARYAHLTAIDHAGAEVMTQLDDDFDALVAHMQSTAQARVVERVSDLPLTSILAAATASSPAHKTRRHSKKS